MSKVNGMWLLNAQNAAMACIENGIDEEELMSAIESSVQWAVDERDAAAEEEQD